MILIHLVSIKKRADMPAARQRTVKISIGTGKSNSATMGAKIVRNREIMLMIPMDVTENSVGNIRGWTTYTIAKELVTPNFAKRTRMTKAPSTLSPMIKISIPAIADTPKSPANMNFGRNLYSRKPDAIFPSNSAENEANWFTFRLPGKYFTLKLIM